MDWRNYDQTTQLYEQYSNKRFVEDFVVPHLRSGCTVLDVGCGPGAATYNYLLPVLPEGSTLYAIDADAFLISKAKKNYENSGIHFLHMNAVDLQSLDVKFDVITSMFCIHLVKDQKRLWRDMASKLKEGGVLVIHAQGKNVFSDAVICLSKTEKYAKILKEAGSRYTDYIYLEEEVDSRKMLENQIREVLPDYDVSFCVTNHPFQYDSRQQFYKNLEGDNHFRNRMDDALAEVYVGDLMATMQRLQGLGKDEYRLTMTMYDITVKKKKNL